MLLVPSNVGGLDGMCCGLSIDNRLLSRLPNVGTAGTMELCTSGDMLELVLLPIIEVTAVEVDADEDVDDDERTLVAEDVEVTPDREDEEDEEEEEEEEKEEKEEEEDAIVLDINCFSRSRTRVTSSVN